MDVKNIEPVGQLTVERQKALTMLAAFESGRGSYEAGCLWFNGDEYRVCPFLPEEPIRQAIIETLRDRIAAVNKELASLGVRTPTLEIPEMDAGGWRRTAEMYLRVWLREMGGRLIPKTHLIDALALTTQRMRRHQLAYLAEHPEEKDK